MNGAVVRVYSKAKDGNSRPYMSNGKRCANFKVKEFACHDGSDPVFIAPELVTILQTIRTHYGKPVIIEKHSAYRTVSHNSKPSVGGAKYSQHLYGMACDFHVEGVSPAKVAAYAETLMPNRGGIGTYATFTHIDVRAVKSRWKG